MRQHDVVMIEGSVLGRTRRSLHAVAELVLAGPQLMESGRIELRARPGGFGTVAAPDLRVDGHELVTSSGRLPLHRVSAAELAAAAGVTATPLDEVYSGGPRVPADEVLLVDSAAARALAAAFALGDSALRAFAPQTEPVLWPEHFDIAVTVDEVNYGVSPGDGVLELPYAYVGPWEPARHVGSFWNAPFGATRELSTFRDADDLVAFFIEGRTALAEPTSSPVSPG